MQRLPSHSSSYNIFVLRLFPLINQYMKSLFYRCNWKKVHVILKQIKKILEIEEKYKRMPKEKEEALAACGVQLRNYQEIKKNICDCYGDLQRAIQCGHIYFVRVRKTK